MTSKGMKELNTIKKEIRKNLKSISREINKLGYISSEYIIEKTNLISLYTKDIKKLNKFK